MTGCHSRGMQPYCRTIRTNRRTPEAGNVNQLCKLNVSTPRKLDDTHRTLSIWENCETILGTHFVIYGRLRVAASTAGSQSRLT